MVIEVTKLISDLEAAKMDLFIEYGEFMSQTDVDKVKAIEAKLDRLYRWVGIGEYEDLAKRANY